MWADNETSEDLLGFKVHADLLINIIKDESVLPITIGVFGDWGSGKSSILQIVKEEFDKEDDKDSLCIYFNGWTFEGYDDAKAALLNSILKELEDNKKISAEIKDTIKEKAKKLWKSIDWMRGAGMVMKNVALPAVSAYFTGGLSLVPFAIQKLTEWGDNPEKVIEKLQSEEGKEIYKAFVKEGKEEDKNATNAVAEFRKDFSELLEATNFKRLVVIIDELEKLRNNERILLVSHFDSKSPGPNGDQRKLLRHLMTQYSNKIYWIQSKLALSRKDIDGNRVTIENNYRSRSLFFIGLGCYLSPIDELIIPENGTISINYPLTPSRVSSLSTRTTHPYVLKNTQELLAELGLSTLIHNPYTYKTKGEMFVECANQTFLQNIYQDSVSCGKRGRRQFHFDNPNEKHNCGRCMPCIYRRAALNKAGLDNENHYGNFITKAPSLGNNDLPALFSYLKRNIPLEKMKRDLLVNGNIDIDSLTDYAEMVLRSKAEVLQLFNDKGNRFVKSELGIR